MDDGPRAQPNDPTADPTVVRGRILCYRVFDAGDTIALDTAEARVKKARRLVFGGPMVEGLRITSRPLEVDMGERDLTLHGPEKLEKKVRVPVTAHVFEWGAVSFLYEMPIEAGTKLSSLTPFCSAIYEATELDVDAESLLSRVVADLGDTIDKPHAGIEPESFTVIFAQEVKDAAVPDISKSEVTAKLLIGETSERRLSPAVREDTLKNAFSYLADDLVVVDWNSALVIEPTGSLLVPHLLELATSQLLEFRFYDQLIDAELERVYAHVEKNRPRILRSPYGTLTRQVVRRFMELTEVTERVDNAIKSVGDVYLARVYVAAINRFRVPEWRESVESKLAIVNRAYTLLKSEVESTRNQLLEIVIIILILAELLAAFRGFH